jgi:hypothetical protein
MRTTSWLAAHRIVAVSVAVAVMAGGCASLAPKAERYVPPPLGATWVNERRDTGSYGSTTVQAPGKRGERVWQGKPVITFEGPDVTLVASSTSGAWLAQVRGDTPVLSWDPPLSWDWPLEVGKTWTKKYTVTNHATKQTIPFETTQKVEAYEDVTVPAGKFKAFKVTTIDTLGNQNVNWFSPELGIFVKTSLRRTEKHPLGPGTRETQLVSQTIKR